MHTYLIDMLICPRCHSELAWKITEQNEDRVETAEVHCRSCDAVYSVRDGIGLFLTPDLPRNDLWDQVDSGLVRHLRANPDLERQLMSGPVESLNPADQFLRALMLEAEGSYIEAKSIQEAAFKGMYEPAYLACWNSQTEYLLEAVAVAEGPIVDLASGRGYLMELIVRKLQRPIAATDFSPGVLRRNRRWLTSVGLYNYVSLLAFDARRTPFKDSSVATLTTNLGLPNIEEPGALLQELRRVVSGVFLAISQFYPEDDQENGRVIDEASLDLLYRRIALAKFVEAGWSVELQNRCMGEAQPTPPSNILEGVRIDGLPIAETMLEWGVLVGKTS